ncbi:unnamed protein product [Brassicogethes aeneus]|uniref:Uncharacterized protein n=1 Tax=Brassicogethes aeneus TaxID=1431903 RepID=A0A9P0BCY8_BRAAE|nr:unnamed protein product [Brassicogethes aeneus]
MGGITQRPWTPTKRRGPIAAEYNSPGPACVNLPSYMGKNTVEAKNGRAPAFSFGARHGGRQETLGPGPGQYNVTGLSAKGKDTPLAVSLHGRPKSPKAENFPAPGDYNPDKAEKVIHDNSPKYTFGLKTNLEKPLDTPAPNAYSPFQRSSSKRYSFGIRTSIRKHNDTPAPNFYNIPKSDKVLHEKSPQYSFGLKTQVEKPSETPAPNVYNIPSTEKLLHENSPKYSFGVKVNLEKFPETPAPNVYDTSIHDNSPRYSFGVKVEPEKPFQTPAPNAYKSDLPESAPRYSFGVKVEPEKPFQTPAPNVYNTDIPDSAPRYSFGVKVEGEKPFETPAPNVYNVQKSDILLHDHSPQYSFGNKCQVEKPMDTPGPNVYQIPSVVCAPAYTISGRNKEPIDERVKNPGPGQYNNVDPESYKAEHSPAYTISGRTNIPRDDSIPGPGIYSPEKVCIDYPPAHSFGIKHSPFSDHY